MAIQVTTTVTAAGAATVRFQLQGADDAAFTTNVATLVESGEFPKAVLTAGAVASLRVAQSKVGPRKYVRVYYVVTNGPLTAGAFSAFVALDVQAAPVHFPSGLRF